jgi:hypothetical protein
MNKRSSVSQRGKTSTVRKTIFRQKKEFHQMQARLSFAEKIRILVELQKIARNIKKKDIFVWQI